MELAFDYLKTHALAKESDYPYTGREGTCKQKSGLTKVSSFIRVAADKKTSLENAIEQGPVSVAIEADTYVFQSYKSGIIRSSSCGTHLDHGVLAVGLGSANGVEYYIVKNSWGSGWGEKGYVRIARTTGYGICGINRDASQPYV